MRNDVYLKHWVSKNAPTQKKARVGTLFVNSRQAKGRSPTFIMGHIGSSEENSKLMYLPFGASRADESSEKITLPVRFSRNDAIADNFKSAETALKEALVRSIAKGIPGYESLKNWADSLSSSSGAPFTITTSGSGSASGSTSTRMSGPLWDAVDAAWISKLREDEKYDPMITLQTYETNVNPNPPKRNQTLVYEIQFPSDDAQAPASSTVTNGVATLAKGTRGVSAFEASKVWFKTRPGKNGTKILDQCGVILTLRSFAAVKRDDQNSDMLDANFNGLFEDFPMPPSKTTNLSRKRSIKSEPMTDDIRPSKKPTVAPGVNVRVVIPGDGDEGDVFDANTLVLEN